MAEQAGNPAPQPVAVQALMQQLLAGPAPAAPGLPVPPGMPAAAVAGFGGWAGFGAVPPMGAPVIPVPAPIETAERKQPPTAIERAKGDEEIFNVLATDERHRHLTMAPADGKQSSSSDSGSAKATSTGAAETKTTWQAKDYLGGDIFDYSVFKGYQPRLCTSLPVVAVLASPDDPVSRTSTKPKKPPAKDKLLNDPLFQLLGDGLIAAGGYVSRALTKRLWGGDGADDIRPMDIDLFIVGLTAEQAIKRIQTLYSRLMELHGRLEVSRTYYTITFEPPAAGEELMHPVQVVLRLYPNISAVLHGFDHGGCCVATDGKELWFTSLGLYAFTHRAIIIDLDKRRSSYEKRLCKYSNRGFRLIMPNLDLSQAKLPIMLPYLYISGMPHDINADANYLNATRVTLPSGEEDEFGPYDGGLDACLKQWRTNVFAIDDDADGQPMINSRRLVARVMSCLDADTGDQDSSASLGLPDHESKDDRDAENERYTGDKIKSLIPLPRVGLIADLFSDIKPQFPSADYVMDYVKQQLEFKQPYMIMLRHLLGFKLSAELGSQDPETVDYDAIGRAYAQRIAAVSAKAVFPAEFAPLTADTRLMHQGDAIPLAEISAQGWYGQHYRP